MNAATEAVKEYLFEVEIIAQKELVIKAIDEDQAIDLAYKICEFRNIPVKADDIITADPVFIGKIEGRDKHDF